MNCYQKKYENSAERINYCISINLLFGKFSIFAMLNKLKNIHTRHGKLKT